MPSTTLEIGTGCPFHSAQFPHFGLLTYAFHTQIVRAFCKNLLHNYNISLTLKSKPYIDLKVRLIQGEHTSYLKVYILLRRPRLGRRNNIQASSLYTIYEAKYVKMNKGNCSELYFRFKKIYEVIMKKIVTKRSAYLIFASIMLCVLLPLENLLWAKLRDYEISRVNPNPRLAFRM